jgi:hypothetical protein
MLSRPPYLSACPICLCECRTIAVVGGGGTSNYMHLVCSDSWGWYALQHVLVCLDAGTAVSHAERQWFPYDGVVETS